MRLSSRRIQKGGRIQLAMTSMIDVVFLLLIFFITTSNFVPTERNLDPAVQVDKSASGQPSELEPVIVNIVEEDGQWVYRLGGRSVTQLDELVQLLEAMPAADDGAFVKVADGAPFGMAAIAIQACKQAHFTTVSYVPDDSSP